MAELRARKKSQTSKDADAKIKEKREKIQALMRGSSEPEINPLNYKTTLIIALNWYNTYSSNIEKKKWALEGIVDKPRKVLLGKLDDLKFRQLGMLVRLQSRNQYLEDNELDYIKNKFLELDELSVIPTFKDQNIKPKKVVTVQDKILNVAKLFASEIDGEIDGFIKAGYPKTFVFKNSIKTISGQAAKQIPDMYKDQISELEEVLDGKCVQLNESYAKVKTVQVKTFLKLLKGFVSSCTQQVVSAKKVRVTKPKAPGIIVGKLKYLPTFPEFGLKSISPIKLIDAKEVWLYDTVKRKLTFYTSATGETLNVKGTTIIGYDTAISRCKIMRIPARIKDLVLLNKKQLLMQFKAFTCKEGIPNGRTNDNMIILRVF
tara:strand:+ start:978 stop:2102 length:1125 start_codon:yes stop_codon:yes gene_type:complete